MILEILNMADVKIPTLQNFSTGPHSESGLDSYPLAPKPDSASQPQPMDVPTPPSEGKVTGVIQPGVNQ
jgi:hypothetical protein